MAMEKTARGLVEYAKAQLGRPYWYGTYGQAASKPLYNYLKGAYPGKYTWDYASEVTKVHDCCGLIKGYLWCDSPEDNTPAYCEQQDISANMMRDISVCDEIGTIPEIPGVLVFYNGHVGVYIGSGEVIEARGHKYGVVKTKLKDRPWKWWGYCPFISYGAPEQEELVEIVTVALPVLQKGDKSDCVKAMQNLLLGAGYEMKSGKTIYGADGSYGGATRRAVEAFQKGKGLDVTGVCDAATWAKLLGV